MRKLVILALPLLALAAACGGSSSSPSGSTDYSPNYAGSYSGTSTGSSTSSATGQTSTSTSQTAFQIAAGVAASDLVFGGSCGLTGHPSSASNFITFQKTCSTHDPASNCDYTYSFQAGAGTKNGTALTMSIPGTYTSHCPAGNDSGTMNLTWNMTKQ
jgi:hypothetical protein